MTMENVSTDETQLMAVMVPHSGMETSSASAGTQTDISHPSVSRICPPTPDSEDTERQAGEEQQDAEPKSAGAGIPVSRRTLACLAAGTVAAVAAPIAIPAALTAAGFTSAGVAAGSLGASMMSVTWKAGYGMALVSSLQSAGAVGVGAKVMAATGAVVYKVADVLSKK